MNGGAQVDSPQNGPDGAFLTFHCPHCAEKMQILVNEIACRIFRHGIMKEGYGQMNPHAPKSDCDRLVSEDLIYGCGKPFRLEPQGSAWRLEVCEYI